MSRSEKSARPKARLPRGFRDRFGVELEAERRMLESVSRVYRAWGFDELETPAIEYTDALGKFLPDIERPNAGVFSLQDDDEQWLSLRYDLTAPLARYVAEHFDALPKPFRRYAVGSVWRNEKPGPGRYRQFTQCDADTVGAPSPHADAECIAMMAEAIAAAGLAPDEFVIRISDRNALTGLLESIGLAAEERAPQRLKVLRAMDKLDRLGEAGVRLLLGPGRKDESGDFTDGAGLPQPGIDKVMEFMGSASASSDDALGRLSDLAGGSAAGAQSVETLAAIVAALRAAGLEERQARIDFSVIRGLEYYTGPVFEAELVALRTDEAGRPIRFGAIASGGRYDGLVARFKGMEVPAVGVSIGVSRLLAALSADRAAPLAAGPIVVLALEPERMHEYQQMARALRLAGLRAEVYVGAGGMKAQLKYADKRGAPLAIIQGSDERARGEVAVKDLVMGLQASKEIDDNAKWREGAVAQRNGPASQLVEIVKAALADQARSRLA